MPDDDIRHVVAMVALSSSSSFVCFVCLQYSTRTTTARRATTLRRRHGRYCRCRLASLFAAAVVVVVFVVVIITVRCPRLMPSSSSSSSLLSLLLLTSVLFVDAHHANMSHILACSAFILCPLHCWLKAYTYNAFTLVLSYNF